MANPQLENGYTRIANEILEHLYGFGLSGGELAMCLMVLRKTYGYKGKKLDFISLSQFEKGLGLSHWYVSKIKRVLVSKRLLVRSNNRLGINKNWNEWVVSNSLPSKQQNNLPVSNSLHTKESITKEILLLLSAEKSMYKLEPDIPNKIINYDTLEEESEERKELIAQKGYDPKLTNELLAWGMARLGRKFTQPMKQKKHIANMLGAGINLESIKVKWEELEDDKFWGNKGIDFSVVASQIDKVKSKKDSSLLWDK